MDYRENQKVLYTLSLEDDGQDFNKLDILENGVLLGNSIIFKDGRISLLGIGTRDGEVYFDRQEVLGGGTKQKLKNYFIYIKDTGKNDPLPWNAKVLNYKILSLKKAIKPNRFIK